MVLAKFFHLILPDLTFTLFVIFEGFIKKHSFLKLTGRILLNQNDDERKLAAIESTIIKFQTQHAYYQPDGISRSTMGVVQWIVMVSCCCTVAPNASVFMDVKTSFAVTLILKAIQVSDHCCEI